MRFTRVVSGGFLIPGLALTAALATAVPASAERNADAANPRAPRAADQTPTTPEVVAALEDAGSKVLLSAPALVSDEAAISRAKGIEVTVPRDPSTPVELSVVGRPDVLKVGIPGASDSTDSVVRDGLSIFTNATNGTATAVNPLGAGGAQFLLTIGGSSSPTRYDFPVTVPEGATLRVTETGGAEVAFADGVVAAIIPAPWAVDADQQPVPTHFEVLNGALVQVVSHATVNAEYPVVADPSIFNCDWYTYTCVKLTRGETHYVAGFGWALPVAAGAATLRLCGLIPFGPVSLACSAYVAVYATGLVHSARSAYNNNKCLEVHIPRGVGPLWWKSEGC